MESDARAVKGLMLTQRFVDIQEETPEVSRGRQSWESGGGCGHSLKTWFGSLKI